MRGAIWLANTLPLHQTCYEFNFPPYPKLFWIFHFNVFSSHFKSFTRDQVKNFFQYAYANICHLPPYYAMH